MFVVIFNTVSEKLCGNKKLLKSNCILFILTIIVFFWRLREKENSY